MPYFKLTFVLGASAALTGLAGAYAAARPAAQPWTVGLSSNRESRDAEIYAVRSDGTGARRQRAARSSTASARGLPIAGRSRSTASDPRKATSG